MIGTHVAVVMGPIDVALPGALIGLLLFALFALFRILSPIFGRVVIVNTSVTPGCALARRARRNFVIFLAVAACAWFVTFGLYSLGVGVDFAVPVAVILFPLGVGGVFMWASIWACAGLFGRMSEKRRRFLASGGSNRRLQVEAGIGLGLLVIAIWLGVLLGSMAR